MSNVGIREHEIALRSRITTRPYLTDGAACLAPAQRVVR